VVAELGYGTTGLTVGQRVFGVTDWCRNGTLANSWQWRRETLRRLSDVSPHYGCSASDFRSHGMAGLFTTGTPLPGRPS